MRVITVARKPLSESSVAANVLEHGTGAINIDATRIGTGEDKGIWPITDREDSRTTYSAALTHTLTDAVETDTTKGRWPANLILQHLDGCGKACASECPVADLDRGTGLLISGKPSGIRQKNSTTFGQARGNGSVLTGYGDTGTASRFFKQVGGDCAPGCPVADLDLQSGDCPVSGAAKTGRPARGGAGTGVVQFGVEEGNGALHNDTGGASRFFKQVGGDDVDTN